jgi:hypothetical protein
MAILDAVDIERLANRTFSEDETSVVEKLIEYLQGELEAFLDRSIEVREFINERHVVDLQTPFIFLRNTPIVSITSVLYDGYALSPDFFTITRSGLDLSGYRINWPGSSYDSWPYPGSVYEVSYIGGLDGANDPTLKSVLSRAVLRSLALANEGDEALTGITRMQVEDFMWMRSDRAAEGIGVAGSFLESDVKVLSRYRRRRLV